MDNKEPTTNPLLTAIQHGKVKMRPKWHFILRAVLIGMGTVIVLLALFYIISLIIFILHFNGAWFVPAFGYEGWYALVASLPWALVGLTVLFLLILEQFVRHYAFAYHQPLLYTALSIVVIAFGGGILVAYTPLHMRLSSYAEHRALPFAGRFYHLPRSSQPRNIHHGIIRDLEDTGFILQNSFNELLHVHIVPQTRFPRGTEFGEGDEVIIFGNRDDDTITAQGIRALPTMPIPGHGMRVPFNFMPRR